MHQNFLRWIDFYQFQTKKNELFTMKFVPISKKHNFKKILFLTEIQILKKGQESWII